MSSSRTTAESNVAATGGSVIKALDSASVHRISSGQVVVDLQTAVKELVENSLDAGATNIEVRFRDHGLQAFEVVDNGSGIAPEDYDAIALKHHTSKLSAFADLTTVQTFGFRGEALSSLCALAQSVTVTTATPKDTPMGTIIEFDRVGRVTSRSGKVARQRGTTVVVSGLFQPLPVRRKELERNAKREYGKALTLLSAYALVPCAQENRGVRLTVTHQPANGKKSVQLRTDGSPSTRASVSALWGPKSLENLIELDLRFDVDVDKSVLRRQGVIDKDSHTNEITVKGLVSKFSVSCGRASTDRQFFFINGRPCNPSKVQKAINEVYRTFNANQVPFIIADFILPTDSLDVNVSPDKRTILLHSEGKLIMALKAALEEKFSPARATFDLNGTQSKEDSERTAPQPSSSKAPLFLPDNDEATPPAVAVDDRNEPSSQEVPVEDTFGEPSSQEIPLEDTFGEPVLLQVPSVRMPQARLPDGDHPPLRRVDAPNAPSLSDQEHLDTDASTEGIVRPLPQTAADRDEELETDVLISSSDITRYDATRSTPRSPTVTQIQTSFAARRSYSPAPLPRGDEANTSPDTPLAGPSRVAALDPAQRLSPISPSSNAQSSRPVQMVLSTSGASWDLRASSQAERRESKRARLDSSARSSGKGGKEARLDLRKQLKSFARTGSQVVDVEMDEQEAGSSLQVEPPSQNSPEGIFDEDEDLVMGSDDERQPADVEVALDLAPLPKTPVIDLSEDYSLACDEAASSSIVQAAVTSDTSLATTPSAERRALSAIEVVRSRAAEETPLDVSLDRIMSSWCRLQQRVADGFAATQQTTSEYAQDTETGVETDDEKAAEVLSRVIDKTDFAEMEIVGQFNLGFIIARRQKADGQQRLDDLFIVDQHAADEKYNFETLQQTTRLESQKLFRPLPLEFTAADELLAMEKIDVLRHNGFEVEEVESIGGGPRLHLVAQPVSKSTSFDVKDLEELLHLMQVAPDSQMARPSKVRSMFAMRACRKSVMVGMPLTHSQMRTVVRHMGTMDQPWHCPHGRPTMRHLSDIAGSVGRSVHHTGGRDRHSSSGRAVDWQQFATQVAS